MCVCFIFNKEGTLSLCVHQAKLLKKLAEVSLIGLVSWSRSCFTFGWKVFTYSGASFASYHVLTYVSKATIL